MKTYPYYLSHSYYFCFNQVGSDWLLIAEVLNVSKKKIIKIIFINFRIKVSESTVDDLGTYYLL